MNKNSALFALALCVVAVKPTLAQNDVQITISVLPPYSAYLQDYAGAGKQVQVFVRNTTANRQQVRLQGSVTGDNGVIIQTLPNYRPPQPLVLEPFQNRLLTYADLSGLFDLNQIDAQGVDRNNLYKGLPLPEGMYQLCVRAFDNATSRPLSPDNPLGCSPPFPVRSVEPPILISPLCDSDVQALNPQNIVFTWTPPVGVSPATVDYTLRIVELPLESVDPNVFIDAIVLPKSGLEVRNLKTSTFLYSVVHPPLIPGKKYAWRVQARDLSGRTNFLNDGKSPVCAFQYGPHVSDGLDTVKTTPVVKKGSAPLTNAVLVACNEPNATSPATLTVGYMDKLALSWKASPQFLADLAGVMGFGSDSASLRGALQKIDGAAYQVSVFDAANGQLVWKPAVTTKEFITADPNQPGFSVEFGKLYNYTVQLVLPDEVRDKLKEAPTNWFLLSKLCSFRLKRVKKPGEGFLVRGQIRYKFDTDGQAGDYPANNTDVKISFTNNSADSQVLLADASKGLLRSATPYKPQTAQTPQQKLAAVGKKGGVEMATQTGTATGTVKPAGTGSGATAPPPTGDLPNTYYTKTDADGYYELPIPWEDLPTLVQGGSYAGADKTLTALNYQLELPSGYYQNSTQVRSFTYTPGSTSVAVGVAKVNVHAYSMKLEVSKDYNTYYQVGKDGKPISATVSFEKKVDMDQTINQAVDGISTLR